MKDQYVGDVNDFRKYALLRAWAKVVSVGVNWMLTAPDRKTDGGQVGYLLQPERWRAYDPELFDLLKNLVIGGGTRSIKQIEIGEVVPRASYFSRLLPDNAEKRREMMASALLELSDADLIFFDPDNGLEVASKKKGWKYSSKFLFWDEVEAALDLGKSVLVYQHFTREERATHLERLIHSCTQRGPNTSIWTFHSPRAVFICLLQPQHRNTAKEVQTILKEWPPAFIQSRQHR